MNPTNSSGFFTSQPIEVSDPPVIQMNSSEKIFNQPMPAFYEKIIRTIPNRPAKLVSFLPLDKKATRIIKRAGDIVLSMIVILMILSWLLPIMALLIKLNSKGPVFFLQKRSGRNKKLFTCIKFRSMVVNSESDLRAATSDDERITRLGKFLRNHYLDELPQFFNVFMGDMSLIGPRPHMINDNLIYQDTISHYDFRYKVKPGITGLAQVLGFAGPVDDIQKMKDRVQLDIFYIRHWSFALDMKIIFRTALKIF
jgi:lipopolysaccharide/colanic/teichoic acid biosynthesis glycosyltransferase